MSDHVRELVGKVAEGISSRGGNNSSADNNWIEAEWKVKKYIKLRG